MQSVIYSTILSILSIEAVPHVQFVNTSSKSIMDTGNEGIIISDHGSVFGERYKNCSRTADLLKYGKNNFEIINSTKVKINDPINHGYLLHVPNSGPGWKTKNKIIIKKVLEGDKYVTDNDCGLTAYYSEEGELIYFKNNGIIVDDVFLQSNHLKDHDSYYEFENIKWIIIIDKKSGKLHVFLAENKENTQYLPSLSGEPNIVKGETIILTKPTDIMTPNDTEKNTKKKSETQFHSDLKNKSSHGSSSESEEDDVSEYETADSEFSHTFSKSDETAEEPEINLSPIPSESDYDTHSSTSSESDYDTYSSTSSESDYDTYSSTTSQSDHHTAKLSDNKVKKRFVFVGKSPN